MAASAQTQRPVETAKDFGDGPAGIYNRWSAEIALSQKEMAPWRKRADKIVERYRDERTGLQDDDRDRSTQGLQLLWSTVQTQIPAVFQFPPSPEVSRRFNAKDPAARCAAMILERYIDVDLDRDDFGTTALSVLQDRLLVGRGQVWAEYEPVIRDMPTPTPVIPQPDGTHTLPNGEPYTGEAPQQDPMTGSWMGQQPMPQIVDCKAPLGYLYWDDFLHSTARRWSEIEWVGRRRYFTRDEATEKFADGAEEFDWAPEDIPLNSQATMDNGHEDEENLFKQAEVWEIWDETDVTFIVIGMSVPLAQRPRPLKLPTGKWPCPRPLYATTTNDTLRPIPDFCQWQDLAEEIDELTSRIRRLTEACQVKGARPASMEELDRLVNDSDENELVPVENWAAFTDKGGLANAISWLPIQQISDVLAQLSAQREDRIAKVYQINGIGDILRGQGDPSATATHDRIKATYGSLRLTQMQQEMAAFFERAFQIKAEIIVEKAPPEVLVQVSSIQTVEENPQTIQGGIQMLQSDTMREYRISVDEQSMVAMRDENDKAARLEFAQAMNGMVQTIIQASQQAPQVLDIMGETALYAARSYRAGRELEGVLEEFIDSTRQQAAQARQAAAQNPPPPPESIQVEQLRQQGKQAEIQMKAQTDAHLIDVKTQAGRDEQQAQAASAMATKQMEVQADQGMAQFTAQLESKTAMMKAELDAWVAEMQAQYKLNTELSVAAMKPEPIPQPAGTMG